MSRIGKKPVVIPAGVDVTVADGTVTVKGPKGTLTRTVHSNITVEKRITRSSFPVPTIPTSIIHSTV